MNMTAATTHPGKWEFVKGHYLAAALGATLLAAALVGVGAWQAAGGGGGATVPTPNPGLAVSRTRDEVGIVNYLVASQAQADFIARGQEDSAAIRREFGSAEEPQDQVQVWIVTDEASLTLAMRAFIDSNAIRLQYGLGETTLIDLRAVLR